MPLRIKDELELWYSNQGGLTATGWVILSEAQKATKWITERCSKLNAPVFAKEDHSAVKNYQQEANATVPEYLAEIKRRIEVAVLSGKVPNYIPPDLRGEEGPPFAEQLSISVFGYQVSALERMRVQARLALLAGMTDDEVVGSKFELSSTWLSDVDDYMFLSDDFCATDFLKKNSRAVGQTIGKHGRWKSIGEYGWCKASIPEADHIDLIRVKLV